ncbi:ATP-binding protein [Ideonella sp.]|uniref:ATP-binding protein n=1 Tax=Ideonella sp. TaxID=1929293 RepID=UPI003BB6971E
MSLAPPGPPDIYRFGDFELQPGERRLLRAGLVLPLQAKALDLLITLVEHGGLLLSRQVLLDRVWPDVVVEDSNLTVQINALRRVLGSEWVATVPGRGYRFNSAVQPQASAALAGRDRPPFSALRNRHGNLPEVAGLLIGRDEDLAALSALLDRESLVTLTGAGGMGKTRLAVALLQARQALAEHGACFVDLSEVTQAEALADAIAAAAGLRRPEGGPAASLGLALAPLELLIVLDNAEHMVEAVAGLVQALRSAAPRLRLLITSQVPLRLAGEVVYRLGPLAVPDEGVDARTAMGCGAVALFVLRVQAQDHRFRLDDGNVELVSALCRSLDGAALAIELAAARVPMLGLPALLASMSERLRLLNRGPRDAPSRQQTLRATLSWSHGLLSPAEQVVFRRMAVFHGGAPLSLVRRVVADDAACLSPGGSVALDEWEVLDALGGLVDRALVQCVDSGLAACASDPEAAVRYQLLESPRALAAECLQAAAEAPWLQARHAAAVRAWMQAALADLLDGRIGMADWVAGLGPDLDNAAAALHQALQQDPEQALAMAPVLALALGRTRHRERSALWTALAPLLDGPPLGSAALRAVAGWQCAEHWATIHTVSALAQARIAHAASLQSGDSRLVCLCLDAMAFCAWRLHDGATLEFAVTQLRALQFDGWSAFVRSSAAAIEAWHAMTLGDFPGALHWFRRQAEGLRAAGMDDARAFNNVAGVHLLAGQTTEAIAITGALVERMQGTRDLAALCAFMLNHSAALLAEDRAAEARAVLVRSWPLARQFDRLQLWADDAAQVAALAHRPEAALRLLGYADAVFAARGQPREMADQVRYERSLHLARTDLSADHDAAAIERLRASGAALTADELAALAFSAQR